MSKIRVNEIESLDGKGEGLLSYPYEAGLEITSHNTVVRVGDTDYKLSESTLLPYTTTGAGMPEGGAFVTVGDAALRQELADPALGGDLVQVTTSTGTQPLAEALVGLGALAANPWISKPIGEPFPILDHLSGIEIPPTNNPNFRFIKLTAGEDGTGQYNEGKLTGETVSGSAPLVTATAEISDAESPMFGETVHLLNTERRYLQPGESAGTVANDVMQQITGTFTSRSILTNENFPGYAGSFTGSWRSYAEPLNALSNDSGQVVNLDEHFFDSANSPDARTGDHTAPKHIEATYYMRIA